MSVRPNLATGTTLNISSDGNTYHPIQLLSDVTVTKGSSSLDTTDLSSTSMTYIKGLADSIEISGNFRYDYDADTETLIQGNLNASGDSAALYCELSLAGLTTPKTWSFQGFFTNYSINSATNSVRTGSLTIKSKGAVTIS